MPASNLSFTEPPYTSQLEGLTKMSVTDAELDEMQQQYKAAVDVWVAAIRHEEALASGDHSVAQIDSWEEADDTEDALRDKAKVAKKDYEDALREKFVNF